MTDHARPPEGVETWTIRNVPVKYLNAVGENADGELHLVSGRHPPLGESFTAVSLDVFLAEREARERAERDVHRLIAEPIADTGRLRDSAPRLPLLERLHRAERDRDAAVARAEQAERHLVEFRGMRAALSPDPSGETQPEHTGA